MMDRSDATGLGIAFAGHAALLAALSLGLAKASLPPIQTQPMEVELVDEIGLVHAAPQPSPVEPAARLGDPDALPDPLPPAPVDPLPQPSVTPAPVPPQPGPRLQPQPKAAPAPPKAAPRPAPAQKPAARPGGRLNGLLNGVSDRETPSRSTATPAQTAGPAVEASLVAEVRRQLKPHWQRAVPTGADAEKLRTEVSISLARNGTLTGLRILGTTGITASNRPQVELHRERAERAIRLAAPFRLPAEFYESWKELTVALDQRLSQ